MAIRFPNQYFRGLPTFCGVTDPSGRQRFWTNLPDDYYEDHDWFLEVINGGEVSVDLS